MARIVIVTPARPGTRNGNRHTATRWAAMLRSAGHRVSVSLAWQDQPCDALIALHARRSHGTARAFREAHPDKPLVVALTGTDLYKDLPASPEARASLELADRLVVLQDAALAELAAAARRKARVVYQSSDTRLRHAPPAKRFRMVIVGHLREEKDPFRAALAVQLVKDKDIEIVQIGGALSDAMKTQAETWAAREPRYRWLGSVPHTRALRWIAESHLIVVSSVMEGGANVIAEAARIGTPVLASKVSGNVGMLGRKYPGLFALGDERALAALIVKARNHSNGYYGSLKAALRERRPLFAPAEERRSLLGALKDLLQS